MSAPALTMLTPGTPLALLLLAFPCLAQAHDLQFVDYASVVVLLLTGVALALLIVLDRRARRVNELAGVWHAQTTHAGRLALVGQLTASIVHEVTQPLSAILANVEAAQLLLNRPNPDLTSLRAILADIHGDDLRARDIVQRLRTLLRKRKLQRDRTDLNALVVDTLALITPDAQRRGVIVNTVYAPDLPRIFVDAVHLQQVVLNLVINALDAVQDTAHSARRIEIRTERRDCSFVQVSVLDNGHGIAAEHVGHLFDPFFTTKPGGMGLGLQIAHSIVEMHGGTIWAENRAGGGAAFKLLLPVHASPVAAPPSPATNAAGRHSDTTSLGSAFREPATKQRHGFFRSAKRRDDNDTACRSSAVCSSTASTYVNVRDSHGASRAGRHSS